MNNPAACCGVSNSNSGKAKAPQAAENGPEEIQAEAASRPRSNHTSPERASLIQALAHEEPMINLRELLKKDFKIDFPISGGTGNSRDNPIVIDRTERNDYVSVEYGVIKCIAAGRQVEWKIVQQSLIHHNDRMLDQMKVQMTETTPDELRHSIENYYFDITNCVSL